MLKRVKKWLGIEGIKVELQLPETVVKGDGTITGTVVLSSMQAQTVTRITFKLIEKYSRGRRKTKLSDEYLLAESDLNQLIEVKPEEPVEVPFEVAFDLVKSPMDQLEERNFITRGIAWTAKKLKGVKSEYRLEAEADVVGTALNPFDRQPVNLGLDNFNYSFLSAFGVFLHPTFLDFLIGKPHHLENLNRDTFQ